MYRLTLTLSERRALDWIGNRYAHGSALSSLLWCDCTQTPDDAESDDDTDITFAVPEHVAWRVGEIGEECGHRWDCLAPPLARKLTDFCLAIV